jgi:phytoene dehydrogenase-like protein
VAAGGADPIETEATPENAQLKVNMLLSCLPRLKNAPSTLDPRAASAGTFHTNEGYAQLQQTHTDAAAGVVPEPISCEICCYSLSDRSILGMDLAATDAQALTLLGLHGPAWLLFAARNAQREVVSAALRSLNCVLAEPTEDVIMRRGNRDLCLETRTSLNLEVDLGLLGGNIFHRSLHWPWTPQQSDAGFWGVGTAYKRVLVCGAVAREGEGEA